MSSNGISIELLLRKIHHLELHAALIERFVEYAMERVRGAGHDVEKCPHMVSLDTNQRPMIAAVDGTDFMRCRFCRKLLPFPKPALNVPG